MSTPVFRFAPSPNGRLHLGHAFSALIDHGLARRLGGRFLLRLEDIDTTRCRPDYEAGILEDLDWLGIDFDGAVRRQSGHFDDYRAALARLEGMGLVKPSFATRGEIKAHVARVEAAGGIWPRDPDGAPFPPPEEGPRAGEPVAMRLDMGAALARLGVGEGAISWKEAGRGGISWREAGRGPGGEHGIVTADPAAWGDPVLARKEIPTSYHLSVVVDDALQGVTHVVRGRDLFFSTAVHRVLQRLLDLAEPVYFHHDLVTDGEGRKLSKSAADTALSALRAEGWTRDAVLTRIGWDGVARDLERFSRELIALS